MCRDSKQQWENQAEKDYDSLSFCGDRIRRLIFLTTNLCSITEMHRLTRQP